MATKAMKIWGTTVSFNGNTIGEIEDVGRANQTRNLIRIMTTDTVNERAEFLASGIDGGQLTLQVVYEGQAGGVYANLLTDFNAGTVATLLVTYKNGSSKSVNAIIANLETAGGSPDGGHGQFSVTFQLSGDVTYTPAAAG